MSFRMSAGCDQRYYLTNVFSPSQMSHSQISNLKLHSLPVTSGTPHPDLTSEDADILAVKPFSCQIFSSHSHAHTCSLYLQNKLLQTMVGYCPICGKPVYFGEFDVFTFLHPFSLCLGWHWSLFLFGFLFQVCGFVTTITWALYCVGKIELKVDVCRHFELIPLSATYFNVIVQVNLILYKQAHVNGAWPLSRVFSCVYLELNSSLKNHFVFWSKTRAFLLLFLSDFLLLTQINSNSGIHNNNRMWVCPNELARCSHGFLLTFCLF